MVPGCTVEVFYESSRSTGSMAGGLAMPCREAGLSRTRTWLEIVEGSRKDPMR